MRLSEAAHSAAHGAQACRTWQRPRVSPHRPEGAVREGNARILQSRLRGIRTRVSAAPRSCGRGAEVIFNRRQPMVKLHPRTGRGLLVSCELLDTTAPIVCAGACIAN